MIPGQHRNAMSLPTRICLIAFLTVLFAGTACAAPAVIWQDTRPAASFTRDGLTDPASRHIIKSAGSLGGPIGGCCVTGWVDYDFDVPRDGWYELSVTGSGSQVEYLINPREGTSAWYEYDSSGNVVDGQDKVGNFWLDTGRNVIRLQRHYWSGFPRITHVTLRAVTTITATAMRASLAKDASAFRTGECAPLQVHHGGLLKATTIIAEIRNDTGALIAAPELTLPAGGDLRRQSITLPCDREGDYLVTFRDKTSGWLAWRDVRGVSYQVVARAPSATKPTARVLVQSIDMSTRQPDYHGGGATQVVNGRAGRYRESGSVGFTHYQRAKSALRLALPEPSWFAYVLEGLAPQTLYEAEVDYPDDAPRGVMIALRDEAPLSYPISSGFDTGGEFSPTGSMQRHQILFWPRGHKIRIVIMNVHDGQRAAAASVRIYRREPPFAPTVTEKPGGRQVWQWYEEGGNFQSVTGMPEATRYEWRALPRRIAVERWINLARHGGANVIAPTVGVYHFSLYPSRYNRAFTNPESDDLRLMLLTAEKYGMRVIPELHPRADELDWPHAASGHPRPHLLLSKDGKTNFFQADGRTRNVPPYFNPIHPQNQDWYVGYVTELVNRYRDSPALLGISLRLMPWANASLNNFVSGEWGYDDYTVTRFAEESGLTLPGAVLAPIRSPADAALRATARQQWLMGKAREAWLDWRCKKIVALYERLRDAVRAARPDLKLYTTVFTWNDAASDTQALREAGIDLARLSTLEGLEIVDARGTYGRREPEAHINQQRRARLLAPRPLVTPDSPAPRALLSTASYVEATEIVVPPERIGLPPGTKATWSSAALTAAGAHILEHYATQMAGADPFILGDGGNGYAFGQPLLHRWLREYRTLPARPFATLDNVPAPLTVRWLEHEGRFMAYVLNGGSGALTVDLELTTTRGLSRAIEGEPIEVKGERARVTLTPYAIAVIEGVRNTRIIRVRATPVAVSPSHASLPNAR